MTAARAHDDHGVLYRGGRVRTVDPAKPAAEAVATRRGRIVAVGSEESCRRALGLTDTETDGVVDLEGRALLPGFNDAYTNPLVACFYAFHVDLSRARCLGDVLDALADRARAANPGEWVIGLRLTADQLSEQRLPTIAELDAAGAGRPVVLVLRDCHTSVGNTVALAAAGIRRRRKDPLGGRFERDEQGRLTGVCLETGTAALFGAAPVPDLEELRSVAKSLFADIAAQGVTSVGVVLQTDDEGLGGAARALESVGMMFLVKDIPQGIHTLLVGSPAKAADLRASSPLHEPQENRVVGGIKLFLDGTLHAHTAYLHEPYADRPDTRGFLRMDPGTVARRMEFAHLAGLQVCVQASGDRAAAQTLDLLADLYQRHPVGGSQPPGHRIEHVSVLDESGPERFADLKVAAVVQPRYPGHDTGLVDRLGLERSRRAYPFRGLVDVGAVVAGSSAAPAEPTDVLAGIAAAVTRPGSPQEAALTAAEAVELYTRNAAIVQRRDDVTGTITEGKRADLVVLSDDPVTVPPDEIADVEVCQTVIGGHVVHRAATVR